MNKDISIKLVQPFGSVWGANATNSQTLMNVFIKLLNHLNPFNKKNWTTFIMFQYHLVTLPFFILTIARFRIFEILFLLLSAVIITHVYNTVWYHRYCSHNSYLFSNKRWKLLFLWTDPLFFKEEIYAVPHFVHHEITDLPGDPYGPHLGWLVSYLATELTSRIDTDISQADYSKLLRRIDHIGLNSNSYQEFKNSGSIEIISHFLIRKIFGQVLWLSLIFLAGGIYFVFAWLGASFLASVMIRDFNWRGHGGNFRYYKISGWEHHSTSRALNQHFYGYLASEWHDNHHLFPSSANNGFLPTQFDFSFQLVKVMKKLNVLSHYHDSKNQFLRLTKSKS